MKAPSRAASHRIGIDENGLGARLGPLAVTAVLARVGERGARLLARKLPKALRADLDDSKALVSCHDVSLGEAWARALLERERPGGALDGPDDLLRAISLEDHQVWQRHCPPSTKASCWTVGQEAFEASDEQLGRVREHLAFLTEREVDVRAVRTSLVCNGTLERLKQQGINRFGADLHEMEKLTLNLHDLAGEEVEAICGKVGGMAQYGRFFGPLADRLHTTLLEGAAESAYYFPRLGTMRFVRDADASDPLVMLASLVGKYVRELSMRRVAHYYRSALGVAKEDFTTPSGYHDPVSQAFVKDTAKLRKKLDIVDTCFLRSAMDVREKKAPRVVRPPRGADTRQGDLF